MIDSREVTHALLLFSSLFAFSRATFFNGRDCVMVFTEKIHYPLLEARKAW